MVVAPTRTTTLLLLATFSFAYGTPRFTSAAFATSHGETNLLVPTGLNCTEHPFPVLGTSTTTGARFCAASNAGLAKWVIARKSGKYVTAARRQPARTIGL